MKYKWTMLKIIGYTDDVLERMEKRWEPKTLEKFAPLDKQDIYAENLKYLVDHFGHDMALSFLAVYTDALMLNHDKFLRRMAQVEEALGDEWHEWMEASYYDGSRNMPLRFLGEPDESKWKKALERIERTKGIDDTVWMDLDDVLGDDYDLEEILQYNRLDLFDIANESTNISENAKYLHDKGVYITPDLMLNSLSSFMGDVGEFEDKVNDLISELGRNYADIIADDMDLFRERMEE